MLLQILSLILLIVLSSGLSQSSKFQIDPQSDDESNCEEWAFEGIWILLFVTNSKVIKYELVPSLNSTRQINQQDGGRALKDNIFKSLKLKGITYNGKSYPIIDSQVSNYEFFTTQTSSYVEFQNPEGQNLVLYRWIIRLENIYFDSMFSTLGIMTLPKELYPKCPLGYCADTYCQSCLPSQGKVYEGCSKRNCKTQYSKDYACLTEDYMCNQHYVNYVSLDDGVKQVPNCLQQVEECDENQYKITNIPLQKPYCIDSPKGASCSQSQDEYVIYNICCKNNPFVAMYCDTSYSPLLILFYTSLFVYLVV